MNEPETKTIPTIESSDVCICQFDSKFARVKEGEKKVLTKL